QHEAEGHQRVHGAHGDAGHDQLEQEHELGGHGTWRSSRYSPAIISWYLPRIVERRILLVRVSSPSSAASSLSESAKACMRAACGRSSVTRATSRPISAVPSGLAAGALQ